MERKMGSYSRQKNKIWMILGVLAVSVIILPYLLLGQSSYVQIHDQMDGEILNYIYQAKYLFRGGRIPEFMNGMPKAAMLPPAPLGVLFYAVLPPFSAFVAMQWMAVLVGFAGMRGLCKYLEIGEEVSSLVGILFAWIAFYPTYGLEALGQPLLVLSYLRLLRGERKAGALCGIALYAGFSSLSLVGFVWVVMGLLAAVWFGLRREKAVCGRAVAGWLVLTVVYVITNLNLFASLAGEGFVTHRQEMVLRPQGDFSTSFQELFFQGGAYHPVYSVAVLIVTALLFAGIGAGRFFAGRSVGRKAVGRIAVFLGLAVAVALLATLWNSTPIVHVRNSVGGVFRYFQADRVSWVLPMLWMVLAACVADLLWQIARGQVDHTKEEKMLRAACATLLMTLFVTEGALIFRDSTFNKNIRLLLLKDYEQVTWESFYMEDVFDRIDEAIGDEKGRVSVISLGMYPSIALYNGYTCADGYSNNYDLDYKHLFRGMIAGELEKNEEVRRYFDEWGNRLYAVSARYGFDAMLGKGEGAYFEELSYDTDIMGELNIGYVFAAAPVGNAAGLDWELVEGSPFSDESSYYEVWVYRVK